MATENIVKNKYYRILKDATNQNWDRISLWNTAEDTEAADGSNLETKVGSINGITSDLTCEDESIAVSAKAVNDSLGGLQFGVDENGNYGYIKAGADTVTPFNLKSEIYIANLSANTTMATGSNEASGFGSITLTDLDDYTELSIDSIKMAAAYGSVVIKGYDADNNATTLFNKTVAGTWTDKTFDISNYSKISFLLNSHYTTISGTSYNATVTIKNIYIR